VHLLFQSFCILEVLLVAQAVYQVNSQWLAVDIAREVKQMNLGRALLAVKGGTHANVHHTWMLPPALHGVNAIGWQ
jgi:hypothetical protein